MSEKEKAVLAAIVVFILVSISHEIDYRELMWSLRK